MALDDGAYAAERQLWDVMKMEMKKYRYLLWDIDGTILDFEAAERNAMIALFEQFELGSCTDAMLKRYSEINKRYWLALERGEMKKEEILIGRFREFFKKEGLREELAEAFNKAYQVALGDTIVFRDDAMGILQKQKMSCKIIIVTNGTAVAQQKKLDKSGLRELADYIFISEMVGYEKPSIHFFEKVITEVGIVDLSQAIIIGDSLTSDIQGGYNIGIDTCWYNPKGLDNKSELKPNYTIRNLHELEQIVDLS